MARNNVRQHARRTPGGGTTTVRQYGRAGRPRRGIVTPGHAWKLVKKAWAAGRQKKKGLAALFAAGAAAEFTLWCALRLGSIALGTAGILAITIAAGGLMLGGWHYE